MPDDFQNNAPKDQHTNTEITQTIGAGHYAEFGGAVPLPEMIGHYRIIRLIGEGGMGAVYEAEQESPKRRVALKVIKAGAISGNLLRRFEIEAQILGKLDHPGIATIYEAGTFGKGAEAQPFFAMEYVEGELLTEYVFGRKLATRERLGLIAKIAEAVQHAHQKGVIHRDLKPGNILVTKDGQIKILDFGVARATDADIQTATMQTDIGQLIGTIPYMSPEQASGDPDELDTRSDVYALGIVAYELLTGLLPYDVERKMIHEAVRVIREDTPRPLSSINRTFRGDVEIIIGKALVKEKDRRYQSASDFASDIHRYLNSEPIEARPPSTWYQLAKFSKRNKALVAGVLAVLVVSVMGALVSVSFAIGEAEQKRAAIANAEDARVAQFAAESARAEEAKRAVELQQVADFQSEQLGQIDPQVMGIRLRRSLIDSGTEDQQNQIEASLAGINFTNIALEILNESIFERTTKAIDEQFEDQPLVQAQMLQTIADTTRLLGLLSIATDPQLRALQIRTAELGVEDFLTLVSTNNMGYLLQAKGDLDQAEPYLREAYKGFKKLLGDENVDTLRSMNNMGLLLTGQGNLDEAEQIYRDAIELMSRVLGGQSPDTLSTINNLGVLLSLRGKLNQAELYYREVLDTRRRILGNDHVDTHRSIHNLGTVLDSLGKIDEAKGLYLESLAGFRITLGDEHPDTLIAMTTLAKILQFEHKLDESEHYLLEALQIQRRILGNDHVDTLSSVSVFGSQLQAQGKLAGAEVYFQEALDGFRRTVGEDHPNTLYSINMMGYIKSAQGKIGEAEPFYRAAYEGNLRVLGEEHSSTLAAMNNVGYLYFQQGNYEQAEPIFARALEILRRTLGDDHPSTILGIGNMGSVLQAQGKLGETEPYFQESLDTSRRLFGDDHRDTLWAINNLGYLFDVQGKYDLAEPLYREALEGRRGLLGDEDPDTVVSVGNLGYLLNEMGNYEEAEALFAEALAGRRRLYEDDDLITLKSMYNLAKVNLRLGKFAIAELLAIELQQRRAAIHGDTHQDTVQAVELLIDVYTAWHEAEPGGGYGIKAASWRVKLEAINAVVEPETED